MPEQGFVSQGVTFMSRPNTRVLAKSNAQFQKALKRLPLGVASTFRYWGDDRTIYVHHGKGGRTWDIDGNCYVDYRLGYGPAILGYADDRVDERRTHQDRGGGRVGDHGTARAGGRRPWHEDKSDREKKGADHDPYQLHDRNRTGSARHGEGVSGVCMITTGGRTRGRPG